MLRVPLSPRGLSMCESGRLTCAILVASVDAIWAFVVDGNTGSSTPAYFDIMLDFMDTTLRV